MGRVGFIQDKLEIKFLILYVAARLIEPVPFEAMQELTMCDDGIDFFDFSECLSNLVESQHLTLSDDGLYAITEKGLHNGAICESSLPYSVRLRADKNITIYNQKLKRRAQIQSDIAPRRNGTYTVTLAFNDDESQPILKMELMVPKEVMAKDLAERAADGLLLLAHVFGLDVLSQRLDEQHEEVDDRAVDRKRDWE